MLLFSAPVDFDIAVYEDFRKQFEVKNIHANAVPILHYSGQVDTWVCNPKQPYITNDAILNHLPNLKILATPSTGTNHIDLKACERRGVKVLSLLDDRAGLEEISASAEFTFKLLLDALRLPPAHELQGKMVGLVGYGRIGTKMHRYLGAFGAHVCIHDPPKGMDYYSLAWLFMKCDAVVVCCTLNDTTRGMITRELIQSMKPDAALVNTARGEVIDEQGLYAALEQRTDIRFATDVVHGEVEGRGEESRKSLWDIGAIAHRHIAGETYESRTKAAQIILNLLKRELAHE